MKLLELRKEIDQIDAQWVELFFRRFLLVQQIAAYKKQRGLPKEDLEREKEIKRALKQKAKDLHVDENFVEKILELLFECSKSREQVTDSL